MIKRKQQDLSKIKLGRTMKSTAISSLNIIEDTVGAVADTVSTIRNGVELIHNSLEEQIIEQRMDLALTTKTSLDQLKQADISESEARAYLQVPQATFTTPTTTI
jgi:hypothetical protein